jgi:hypothetical protein
MATYISKMAKNGKMQYFRMSEDGKKKMVKRGEYEANVSDEFRQGQLRLDFSEVSEPFSEIEIASAQKSDAQPEYLPEPIPARMESKTITVEDPFDYVKSSVSEYLGRHKLTHKEWKNYASIYYRSCAVCGFVLDDNGNVAAARFMGTTFETRKTVTEFAVKTFDDWNKITESVLSQIRFVNEWWELSEKKPA